jgi:peptide/nickel transport system permease protein
VSLPADQAAQAAGVLAPALADEPVAETPRARLLRRFRHNRAAMVGLGFVLFVVIVAVLSPWITPKDPNATDTAHLSSGPSSLHWLGTDSTGRDLLSRAMVGARASMEVGALVVVFAVAVALPLGLIAGYFGGTLDYLIMRLMDALFAFPAITLAVAISALVLKEGASSTQSLLVAGVAIAVVFIPGFVRLLRAQVLAVREEAFIEAARSVGVSENRMVRRHVFPNVISPMIVQVALTFGYALLAEAGLSFLGFGVQPPTPSWGTMLQEAYSSMLNSQWALIPPGLALTLTVLSINLVGDGLRDALGREVFVVKGSTGDEALRSAAESEP